MISTVAGRGHCSVRSSVCVLVLKHHINYIKDKIAKSVGILKRLKYSLPENTLNTLYNTLILPYLNYCNIIWANNKRMQPLLMLQKCSMRIISHSSNNTHALLFTIRIALGCTSCSVGTEVRSHIDCDSWWTSLAACRPKDWIQDVCLSVQMSPRSRSRVPVGTYGDSCDGCRSAVPNLSGAVTPW